MTFRRVLCSASFAATLAVASVPVAVAQFGGMPGMPGSGFPGGGGAPGGGAPGGMGAPGGGFGGPPQGQPAGPPPACQQLVVLRDETQKSGEALKAANERKAQPAEACKLFKAFLASEAKFVQGMQANQATCGVPPAAVKNMQEEHKKVTLVANQVCDAAEHPRPTGPTLNEMLNAKPVLPEGECSKSGQGIYDTLQCNSSLR
jgi:hypothetical protein